jgi:hypothetical protein
MTQIARLRYLEPDCPLTLAEGLAEFAAANPGLIPSEDPRLRELVRAHDSCHVLFGLTTSIEDETLADTWTIFGSTVTIKQYSEYLKHEEFANVFRELGTWAMIRGVARSVPRALRAIWRTRRMTAKWPFYEYGQFLDTPIAALRRRFNVVPV